MMKFASLLIFLFITQLAFSQHQPLFKIFEKGKIGYINSSGSTVIPPIYHDAFDFAEGLAAVRENELYGFIDSSGKYVLEPQFDYATRFVNGITLVYKQKQSYFIDKTGKAILPTVYRSMKFIDDHKAIITTRAEKTGIIDVRTGKLLLDTLYTEIKPFKHGLSVVLNYNPKTENPWSKAIIDTACNFVVPFNKPELLKGIIDFMDNISNSFHEGLTRFTKRISDDKSYTGLINAKGDTIVNDTSYSAIWDYSCGRAIVVDHNDNRFVIDRNGKKVGNQSFEYIHEFVKNYAIIKTDSGYGIIDTNARIVIPSQYAQLAFTDTSAKYFYFALRDPKEKYSYTYTYGVANLNNQVIIPPTFHYQPSEGFINGLLSVNINGLQSYINEQGKIVWQESNDVRQSLRIMNIDHISYSLYQAVPPLGMPGTMHQGESEVLFTRYKKITAANYFPLNKFIFTFDTTRIDTFQHTYYANTLIVGNSTKNTIKLLDIAGLAMQLEALDEDGKWKKIERLQYPSHTNGYNIKKMAPGTYWAFKIPRYEGGFSTKLRAVLWYLDNNKKVQSIYSNTINTAINRTQFWREPSYQDGVYDSQGFPIREVDMSTIKKNDSNQLKL